MLAPVKILPDINCTLLCFIASHFILHDKMIRHHTSSLPRYKIPEKLSLAFWLSISCFQYESHPAGNVKNSKHLKPPINTRDIIIRNIPVRFHNFPTINLQIPS